MFIPPKIRLHGDISSAQRYIGVAKQKFHLFLDEISLSRLKQAYRTIRYSTATFSFSYVFGQPIIDIFVPVTKEVRPSRKKRKALGIFVKYEYCCSIYSWYAYKSPGKDWIWGLSSNEMWDVITHEWGLSRDEYYAENLNVECLTQTCCHLQECSITIWHYEPPSCTEQRKSKGGTIEPEIECHQSLSAWTCEADISYLEQCVDHYYDGSCSRVKYTFSQHKNFTKALEYQHDLVSASAHDVSYSSEGWFFTGQQPYPPEKNITKIEYKVTIDIRGQNKLNVNCSSESNNGTVTNINQPWMVLGSGGDAMIDFTNEFLQQNQYLDKPFKVRRAFFSPDQNDGLSLEVIQVMATFYDLDPIGPERSHQYFVVSSPDGSLGDYEKYIEESLYEFKELAFANIIDWESASDQNVLNLTRLGFAFIESK